MRVYMHEHAIMVLSGEMPESEGISESLKLSKAEALQFLCDFTGENFGHDVQAWRTWFALNVKSYEDYQALYGAQLRRQQADA